MTALVDIYMHALSTISFHHASSRVDRELCLLFLRYLCSSPSSLILLIALCFSRNSRNPPVCHKSPFSWLPSRELSAECSSHLVLLLVYPRTTCKWPDHPRTEIYFIEKLDGVHEFDRINLILVVELVEV
jgi:hypothetical protein